MCSRGHFISIHTFIMKFQACLLLAPWLLCVVVIIGLVNDGYLEVGTVYKAEHVYYTPLAQTDNDKTDNNSWTRGLEVSFQFEAFYNSIRDYVESEGRFPWHLVDNQTLFAKLNIIEYVEDYAVKGDPFHPLYSEYRSPCWMQSRRRRGRTRRGSHVGPRDASLVCMPYFFLAGFPKSGTTEIFRKLSLHPDVPDTSKEKFFWSRKRGFKYYINGCFNKKTYMDIQNIVNKTENNKFFHSSALIDGTPSTLWRNALSDLKYINAVRMRALLPKAKFVVIMRNPTERTMSHFKHFKSHSPQSMSERIPEFVTKAKDCIRQRGIQLCAHKKGMDEIKASLYYAYLKEWLAVYPRENFLFIKAEDFYENPALVTNKAFDFLGLERLPASLLDPSVRKQKVNHLSWASGNETDTFLDKTRLLLDDFYRPINEKLAQLLNDDRFLWRD